MQWLWVLWVLVGYACGSVPVGWLMGRAQGVDIRRLGSGNVGATNVGRNLGMKWGALCFLLDVFKGFAPVILSGFWMGVAGGRDLAAADAWCWLSVAAATVAGHVFPIFLGFRGGKGVATGLGALLGFWPLLTLPTLAAALTWLLLASLFRYVSLASVLAAIAIPIYLWLASLAGGREPAQIRPFLVVTALIALLVLLRHRQNLARLRAGTEPRLGGNARTRHASVGG